MKNSATAAAAVSAIIIIGTSCMVNEQNNKDNENTIILPEYSITTVSEDMPQTKITEEEYQCLLKPSTIPDKCSSRYGYYNLTDTEREVYDEIVSAAKAFQVDVKLNNHLSTEQLDKICKVLFIEEPELYFLTGDVTKYSVDNKVVRIQLNYKYNSMTVEQINSKVDDKVSEILQGIKPQMEDIDKVKYFHDYIVYNCVYTVKGDYISTAYGALVDGKALCEGYSRAFALLCNKVGIENIFIYGTTHYESGTNIPHIWNMVKLDGEWYNIDVTNDDPPPAEGKEFLGYDFIIFNNFCFPASELTNTEVDSRYYNFPKADSTKYNYFNYYGYYAESYDEGINIFTNSYKYAVKNDRSFVRVKFKNFDDYQNVVQYLMVNKNIFAIETVKRVNHIEYLKDDEHKILQVRISTDVNQKENQQIVSSIIQSGNNTQKYTELYATNYDDGLLLFIKAYMECADSDLDYFKITYKNQADYEKTIQYLFLEKNIFGIDTDNRVREIQYQKDDGTFTIIVAVKTEE